MNEIKVGEYIRTYDGYIGKLVKIIPNVLNNLKIDVKREIKHCDNSIDNFIYTRDGFIVKHSEKLIDLIEIGDYVNGERVLNYDWDGVEIANFKFINPEDFKSIVTKEQFEEMEYKV